MDTQWLFFQFLNRMKDSYDVKGYCYFAVDNLENNEFIGFIGFAYQNYETDFTPNVDIGWRLKSSACNKCFASEGAKRSLEYGFNNLGLIKII